MVIHNEKYTSRKKIWKTFGVVLITTVCVYIPLSANFLREFGVEIKPLSAGLCALLVLAVLAIYAGVVYLQHKKRLNFIYISDEDNENIVFRFYHIQLLMAKCTSYKIPFEAFKKYEITNEGNDTYLTLYQTMGKGQLAKYPPICLNSLQNDEIQQVKDLLNQYC